MKPARTAETRLSPIAVAKCLLRRDRGFTLVEMLVALTVLGVALLALAPMLTGAVRTNASANQMTNANALAREKLEELDGYPRNDPRLAVPDGKNAAGPTTDSTGTGSDVGANSWCTNDLPKWHQPSTGAISNADEAPGPSWFSYPYARTYTVEQYAEDLTTRVAAPDAYFVKRLTVRVRPTQGPFPGLRQTTQSLLVRFR